MGGAHGHGHNHGHAAPGVIADQRPLAGALALILAFMVGEVLVGLVSGSLALLSDAAHMLTDAASIALALWVIRLAARPAAGRMTYGWKRAEILSAQANGLTLVLLSVWLTYEAIRRLIDPPPVAGAAVLVVALVGIVVNLAATVLVSRANRQSLNVEGAFQHILTDLFAFVATAVAGLIMITTDFARADAIASLVVVALMVRAGVGLVRDSTRIFLEAAPAEVDPAAVGAAMAARPDVAEVHDLHIWQITSGQPALSAHVLVVPGGDCHVVRADLATLLARDHQIQHLTLQVDHSVEPTVEQTEATAATPAAPDQHCTGAHGPVHRPVSPERVERIGHVPGP
jgi:cobalt-zinc-cadmium efflux system protein